jgi:hypothetical protein
MTVNLVFSWQDNLIFFLYILGNNFIQLKVMEALERYIILHEQEYY